MRPVGRRRRAEGATSERGEAEEITHKGRFTQHVSLKGRRHSERKKTETAQSTSGESSRIGRDPEVILRRDPLRSSESASGRSDRLICDPSVTPRSASKCAPFLNQLQFSVCPEWPLESTRRGQIFSFVQRTVRRGVSPPTSTSGIAFKLSGR